MKKTYTIYLDFDGTVVEHDYPRLGRANFGSVEVLQKLQNAGHKFILNTYRVELGDKCLEVALDWFKDAWMYKKPKTDVDSINLNVTECVKNKIDPCYWDWEFFDDNDCIFIDDICIGIPLKDCCMISGRMVDWDELNRQFMEHELYE